MEALTPTQSDYEARLAEARRAFRLFLDTHARRESRIVVLHDSDADGVTAGVVLQRTLERAVCVDNKE